MSVTVRDSKKIILVLDEALRIAESESEIILPNSIKDYLNHIFDNINTATSGYLNLLTCLVCASVDDNIDPRYHRQPGKGMPEPANIEGWFSGRSVSEKVIYPWMEQRRFRTAKSGWQTRTFERPNPYTLDYPENIAFIKSAFLNVLDFASKNRSERKNIISYFLKKEILYIKNKIQIQETVSKNVIGNKILIIDVIEKLEKHFRSPNSAHLPVIAIYSVYQVLISEVGNYSGLRLRKLESHQAADSRTGAVGDIELEDSEEDVIEGVEVKHNFKIDLPILLRAREKIVKSCLKRYYILTTHASCASIDTDVMSVIREVHLNHGCQIIVNGVIPTIRYYLRMCSNPGDFIEFYSKNISSQLSVTTEQLNLWLELLKDFES